jgi:FMN phosphatase YigB (HAD superfamily)
MRKIMRIIKCMKYPKTHKEWEEWVEAGWCDIYQEDEVQRELDEEAERLFGSEIKEGAATLSDSSRQILQSYVAAHTALSERRRAYSLAMWILRQAEKRKGG